MRKLNNSSTYYQLTDKIKNNDDTARAELTDFMFDLVKDEILGIIIDLDLELEDVEEQGLVYSMVKEYVIKSNVYENYATYKANVIRSVKTKLLKIKNKEQDIVFDHTSKNVDKRIVVNEGSIDPDDYVIKQELKRLINEIINKLGARELTIIRQYFGFDGLGAKSQNELGDKYGVTHQRIGEIIQKSLKKIRYELENSTIFEKDSRL